MAATRHLLSDRPLPAVAGLDLSQTLAAIRESGFSPWVLKAEVEHDAFKLALKCCVRSGIPVILQLRYDGDPALHAVTVVDPGHSRGGRAPGGGARCALWS